MSFVTIHPRETESARLSLRHVPHDIMTLSPPKKKDLVGGSVILN